jgi:hypothetical protein
LLLKEKQQIFFFSTSQAQFLHRKSKQFFWYYLRYQSIVNNKINADYKMIQYCILFQLGFSWNSLNLERIETINFLIAVPAKIFGNLRNIATP